MKTIKLKSGSTIVIVLFYIALILIMMIGMSYLLARTIQSNRYINEAVQAGYSSESGIELALYELKLRQEGYENQNPSKKILLANATDNNYSYKIDYRTQDEGDHFDLPSSEEKDNGAVLGIGIKKFALFYDKGSEHYPLELLRSNKGLSLTIDKENLPILQDTTDVVEVKLSGLSSTGAYETLSHTVKYSEIFSSIDLLALSGSRVDINEGFTNIAIPFSSFLDSHSNVYLLLRNALRTRALSDSSLPQELKFQLQSQGQIASYYKTITSIGTYYNVSVKRVARLEQDQIPEILSVVILHD